MGCSCTKGEAPAGSRKKKNELRKKSEDQPAPRPNSFSNSDPVDPTDRLIPATAKPKHSLPTNEHPTNPLTQPANDITHYHPLIDPTNTINLELNNNNSPAINSPNSRNFNQENTTTSGTDTYFNNIELKKRSSLFEEDTNSLRVSGGLPERAKISKKSRQNNSLFKSFTNFFRSDSNQQSNVLNNNASTFSLNHNSKQVSDIGSRNSEPIKQAISGQFTNLYNNLNAGRYALQSLPARTQNLLTGQRRFQSGDKPSNGKESLSLPHLRHVSIYLSTGRANSLPDLKRTLTDLQVYCEPLSLDLTKIDLNLPTQTQYTKIQDTIQTYLRRFLAIRVLSEQLTCKYHSGLFLFIVLLEDGECEKLLCPDKIDTTQLKTLRDFFHENKNNRQLLDTWYSASGQFNNNRLFNCSPEVLADELNSLESLLDASGLLRSIQQSEIELVAGRIDPSAIIWLHSCENDSTETEVIGILQSHVLAHNYCQNVSEAGEFLGRTLRSHIDEYLVELEANRFDQLALGVDKTLASEIYAHFDILNEYDTSENSDRINGSFGKCLDGYLDVGCLANTKVKGALVVESGRGEEIVSRFIGGKMDLLRPKMNVRGASLNVFRFCGRTVVSSDLTTVLQSIVHQVCYLLEIHESWSFNSPIQIIKNLATALEKRNQLTQQEKNKNLVATDTTPNQELIIWIVNIHHLLLTPADTALLNSFISHLFKPDSAFYFNLKLVLTTTTTTPQLISLTNVTLKTHESSQQVSTLDSCLSPVKQLLKNSGLSNEMNVLSKLVEILQESRYGLRLSEIFNLLEDKNLKNDSIIVWCLFKFNPESISLTQCLTDHDQVLFKLALPQFKIKPIKKTLTNTYFNAFLNSNFQQRAYLELVPPHVGTDWIIKKTACLRSCLYAMQDVECSIRENLIKTAPNHFYPTLYSLHNDPQQLTSSPKLIPLNLTSLKNPNQLDTVFDKVSKQFYTHLHWPVSNMLLTLSETEREVSLWRLTPDGNLIQARCLRLNKSPKDLRFLNPHTAVILCERNLHMFDLNRCTHTMDMNSTMSANVPYFEVHDSQHVVLLARNRLSVILMKVAVPEDLDEETKMYEVGQKMYSAADPMFLFKAGEDRYLNSLIVSGNGQIMVCGDEVQKPFPLLVWNLVERKLVYDLRQPKHEFLTSINAIGFTGKYMVCGCKEEGEQKNCLAVYDLSTGQLCRKLKAKVSFISVEVNEELNVIVTCLENAQIIVYDLVSGSEKNTINSNMYPVNRLKLIGRRGSSNSQYILGYDDARGFDWTVRVWHLTQQSGRNEMLCSFTCPSRIVACSASSGPGDLLVAVSLLGYKQLLVLKLVEQSSQKEIEKESGNSAGEETSEFLFEQDLDGTVKEICI